MSSHIENSHAYVKPESIAFKTVFLTHTQCLTFFWLHGVLVAACMFSLAAESRDHCLVMVHKLLTTVASLVRHRV